MNIKDYFDEYCRDNNLKIEFSTDMPSGYETANGTFDIATNTLFFNTKMLMDCPEYEKLFYLFHELRHALQYSKPHLFSDIINRSINYVIMYNGVCYVLKENEWKECKIDGTEEFLINVYLGQPYEVDANRYAYQKVKSICGDSEELQKLFSFWVPQKCMEDEKYQNLYNEIDKMI